MYTVLAAKNIISTDEMLVYLRLIVYRQISYIDLKQECPISGISPLVGACYG